LKKDVLNALGHRILKAGIENIHFDMKDPYIHNYVNRDKNTPLGWIIVGPLTNFNFNVQFPLAFRSMKQMAPIKKDHCTIKINHYNTCILGICALEADSQSSIDFTEQETSQLNSSSSLSSIEQENSQHSNANAFFHGSYALQTFEVIPRDEIFAARTGRGTKEEISQKDQTEEGIEGTILQRTFELVNILPVIREKAIGNIHQQQVKDKTYHDQKHHLSVGFDIGEKVLLEDA
ncbi:8416_t:CDS:2, partial [Gigaspora rosea]